MKASWFWLQQLFFRFACWIRTIVEDSTLAVSSPTLQTFYSNSLLTSRQTLYTIEKHLTAGNFAMANSLISGFTPATGIENNYKLFYTLSKTYFATGSLSNFENNQLKKLADKCPAIDGTVVYQARHLYSLVNEIVITYNDYFCVRGNDNLGRSGNTQQGTVTNLQEKSNNWLLDIYPNPAQEEISISTLNQEEKLNISIYDPQGKLLYSNKIVATEHIAKLKLSLLNGIYFVNLSNEQG